MRFVNAVGRQIQTCADWMRLAGPTSPDHVVEGRSAVEMCRSWLDGDAVARVTGLLAECAGYSDVVLHQGIVEKVTQFDGNSRGPRHHDLLLSASTTAGEIVTGVEGKADEAFADPLERHVARAIDGSSATGTPKRVDRLTTAFFGTTLGADPSLGCIHYQLLSALAGTLADARNQNAVEAVLLIHEFRTARTSDSLQGENAAALDDFLARLHPSARRAGDEAAWITDSFIVRGDGRWQPSELPARVAKVVTDRRAR